MKFIFNSALCAVGVILKEGDVTTRCGAVIGPNPSFETVKTQLETIEAAIRQKDRRFVSYDEESPSGKTIPLPPC